MRTKILFNEYFLMSGDNESQIHNIISMADNENILLLIARVEVFKLTFVFPRAESLQKKKIAELRIKIQL